MKKDKNWTIIEIILWTTKYLKKNGIHNARLETEWILCYLLSCQRIDLYLRFDDKLDKDNLNSLKKLISRRVSSEPFQYIIKKGLTEPRLCDEIFIQIIKQLCSNPNKESAERAWILLCLCVQAFPPTKEFEAFLLNFLVLLHYFQSILYSIYLDGFLQIIYNFFLLLFL